MNANVRYSFDTNILFYASDSAAGEKYQRALSLTDSAIGHDCVLTLQSLGELSAAIIRRRAASVERAQRIVRSYRASFPIVPAIEADLDDALLAHRLHNIPFWDAMLWTTARRAGCTLILTEDFEDGRMLGGVSLRNPFLLSAAELDALLQ